MQYRMLALDIDGTLLDSNSQLTARVKQAVRRARESGLRVCLASGRRARSVVRVAWELGISEPYVAFNGGWVGQLGSDQPLVAHTLPRELLVGLLSAWHRAGIPAFSYRPGAGRPDVFYQHAPSWPTALATIREEGENAQAVDNLLQQTWNPLRVSVGDSEQVVQRALGLARANLDLAAVKVHCGLHYEQTWYLEIDPPLATKANGLRLLCRRFGVSPQELVAVGDHLNDTEMIEFAGLGVAMGNARPELKQIADLVIGDHDHDGLADFLDELVRSNGRLEARLP